MRHAPGRSRLSRPARILLILVGVVLFLAISVMLAQVLGVGGAERNASTRLIEAEARGDVGAMVRSLDGCPVTPRCRQLAAQNAARLRRPGHVQVLNYASSTSISLGSTHGTARIAWQVPGRTPVVQCIEVHRRGNPITGFKVHLRSLSAPIRSDASCP
jgi:hypothetical protein